VRFRRFSADANGRSRASAPGAARLLAYVDALADSRAGVIDDERLGAALEALLAEHRARGSEVDDMIAAGATIFITSAGNGRVEVRVGRVDDWRGENVRGHGVALGFLELADVARGG
jgi:hypothetical protein